MSSVTLFCRYGIEARWNKGEPHTVTGEGRTRFYTSDTAAIKAARLRSLRMRNALATRFGEYVRTVATAKELSEIIKRNAAETTTACHTHDFWDANETMLEAFWDVMGRAPTFLDNSEDQTDCAIWNDAWAFASKCEFHA